MKIKCIKAKSNPRVEITETNIVTNQMSKKLDANNYTYLQRRKERYKNEVKVESVLSSNFSIMKAGVKKICIGIRNVLSYLVAVLSTHFIIGKKLKSNIYEKLIYNTKNTIDLVF